MAIYRNIQMSFWTDAKIADTFTPDEKLMYLYLLTNPHTNLCGCYEISSRQIAFEIGFKREQIEKLIKSLQDKRVIVYSTDSREVLLVNWHKYNWTSSEKLRKPLREEVKKVKKSEFRRYLERILYGTDTVSDDDGYGSDTTDLFCSVSDTVTDLICSDTVSDTVAVTDLNCSDSNKKSISADFEELWKLYPRKQGKRNAFEAYKKARKDGIPDEEIRAGIESYSEYVRISGTEPQYIKMGGTFFNQRAWSDDWTPQRKKDKYSERMEAMENWGRQFEQDNQC
ncbi:MAG: hypothetical protein K6G34_06200 [Lachnospiraceae bacterium]|nr:hypothetical protein [Lachnospiraceae bacterium]